MTFPTGNNEHVHVATIPLRWSDFDRYGHLMNANYIEVAQEARLQWANDSFSAHGLEVPAFVVRHLDVDFMKPLLPSAQNYATVESQVVEVGRTSLTTRQEIKDHQGRVACVVETVQVAVDVEKAAPRAITSDEKKVLTQVADSAQDAQ
ncbi:predicted thioesterase [Corynebacterium renale]|uniref:Acyl-CoA thioester hydrolase n=1 Tax=Corynebacterium renale TaxID=1724 RepID=A0A2A9DNI5_9CORY|nr:acyl-CoA thioesterase [Corynebacterium renale]PFG28164.1 acyl-CoA thioester hydrolase [Corynebacterium renale]SQG65245.1 predicted thioesterase [Corynebacterium renale]SQI20278.1 predicted thioesterase [Corynebacterium renale]STC98486.1 predicted thioesterase [Corynebacterium renale]